MEEGAFTGERDGRVEQRSGEGEGKLRLRILEKAIW